jgi:hypothetical protein
VGLHFALSLVWVCILLDVLRLDTSVSEKVVNNLREATSLGSGSAHNF